MGPRAQEETVATNLNQNFNTFINSTILLLLYSINKKKNFGESFVWYTIIYIITYILKYKVEVEK